LFGLIGSGVRPWLWLGLSGYRPSQIDPGAYSGGHVGRVVAVTSTPVCRDLGDALTDDGSVKRGTPCGTWRVLDKIGGRGSRSPLIDERQHLESRCAVLVAIWYRWGVGGLRPTPERHVDQLGESERSVASEGRDRRERGAAKVIRMQIGGEVAAQ
jgi:hypothetical protein